MTTTPQHKKSCLNLDCPERTGGECTATPQPLLSPEELREQTRRSIATLISIQRGDDSWNDDDYITAGNILFVCSRLIKEAEQRGEQKGRAAEFNELLKHGEEAYLGDDWWADKSIQVNSAIEIPVDYIEKRRAELSS